jgi:hypothetical protein
VDLVVTFLLDDLFLCLAGNVGKLDGTIVLMGVGNLIKLVVSALIKIFSFFRLFISVPVRRLQSANPPTAPVPVAEKPQPRTVSDADMSACLQRIENLESMCNQLASKPPEIPEDKEQILLNSFERIRSIEADLERTKRVSSCIAQHSFSLIVDIKVLICSCVLKHCPQMNHMTARLFFFLCASLFLNNVPCVKHCSIHQVLHATVAKQQSLVETLEAVQESTSVRVCHLQT